MDNPHYFEQIQSIIDTNDVVLFMKGTQESPHCGFSSQVVQILRYLSIPFKDVDILADAGLRTALKDFSDWPTFPQLYVKGALIGGCDIVKDMFQAGELQALFERKEG